MGIVYLAQDTRLNRPVALKFLPAGSLDDRDKQRFLNEARAAAVIRHPNICAVYDIEEADSRLFISMAYLEGETLAKRLARGPLPVQDAVGIAIQILRGLDKAHSLGIVHRDIKSNNIIVGFDGHVSILDFGLALLPGAERLTQGGGTIGTLAYMSPEQYDGEVVDTRTDIWSTGVVLYEMLTGELPFGRRNAAAISHAILAEPTPPIERLRPDAPTELRNVVEKALAKKPAGRWRSAHAMESALQPFGPDTRASRTEMETMTVGPAAPGAPRAVPNGHSRKRRLQLVALACGLALLASLGLYFYSRSGAPGSPPESRSAPRSAAPRRGRCPGPPRASP